MLKPISGIINDHNFVRVRSFGLSNLHMKIEGLNPAGSIKMKTALGMVAALEAQGGIGPDTRLIESSSGSLGVALSIVCAERGYRFTCVVDPNTSLQNIKMMRALGAQVHMVELRDANGGFLGTRIAYIEELVRTDRRYYWFNQYANPENPRAHANGTARAIADAFAHVDYLFIGAGTTGTLMGCVQYFSQHRPRTRVVAVDTLGSVTFGYAAGKRHIPGLGTSRRPEIYQDQGIHAQELVAEADTIAMCRYLAASNGILAGGSTGTVMSAVHRWRGRMPADACVVAISPDMGERYLDTIYDDAWVIERFGAVPSLQWHRHGEHHSAQPA